MPHLTPLACSSNPSRKEGKKMRMVTPRGNQQCGTSPELGQVLRSSTSFDIFGIVIIIMYYNFYIIIFVPKPARDLLCPYVG